MNDLHTAALIAVMSFVTVLLRFLPFAVFSGRHRVPPVILYLGDVLPGAALGMLVIYCLRDLSFAAAPFGFPELFSCLATAGAQIWRRNTVISILAGTLCYMVLIHLV